MTQHRPPEDEHPKKLAAPGKDLVPIRTNRNGADEEKVPAPKSQNFFASFEELKDQFDEQCKKVVELNRLWSNERHLYVYLYRESVDLDDVRDLWEGALEGAEQCAAALQQQWAMIKNTDIHHPPTEYFMIRIAEMVGKFPEEKLSEEAAVNYATGLAERLQAEDLSVMVLESVFREIEDDRKKPPTISDVLPLLKKHKNNWQRRLDAIDVKNIQRLGEETIFALEFKNAVFKEAVIEYLDAYGYIDLADGVRADDFDDLHFIAIHSTARSEGLTELVAELEAPSTRSEIFNKARYFLTDKKHVKTEWLLRMLNAQRRLNRGKSLACRKCGAGYDDTTRCKVCENGGDIVGIKLWDEHAAREQQPLEDELEQGRLLRQCEQRRRKKLECQRREQFVEARSAMRIARGQRVAEKRFQYALDREWAEIAKQQEIEWFLQRNMERAYEEHWEAIASEYDPWLHVDAETIKLVQSGVIPRRLTDEEFAELKEKARRELAELKEKARLELIERTKRVIEEQRDEAMRDLQERLEALENWRDGVDDHYDLIRELRGRLSDLEYDR